MLLLPPDDFRGLGVIVDRVTHLLSWYLMVCIMGRLYVDALGLWLDCMLVVTREAAKGAGQLTSSSIAYVLYRRTQPDIPSTRGPMRQKAEMLLKIIHTPFVQTPASSP